MSYMDFKGIFYWRMPIGAVLQQVRSKGKKREVYKPSPIRGFPDLCGIFTRTHKGRMFVVELKSHKGRVSEHQKNWLEKIHKAGGAAAVIRSLDELIEFFKKYEEV